MLLATTETAPRPSFADVYREHAAFVWRSLRRLGVRESDAEDVCQEAFLVVHKKLATFRTGSMRGWLFAIAVRVAADYRKRAHVRREVTGADVPEPAEPERQTTTIDRERARVLLESILATLDEDKRAVFIAYELEEMPMAEIAAALECPVQTAYSRLHAARDHVTSSIERWQKRGEPPAADASVTHQSASRKGVASTTEEGGRS